MNKKITSWEQLRFSIIGGLLARTPEPGKLGEEIRTLAGRCYWAFSNGLSHLLKYPSK